MENKARYLQEFGINLQKIVKRLLSNQQLLRLLSYTDKDPLNPNKEDVLKEDAYKDGRNGVVRIVPIIEDKDNSTSIISLRVAKGEPISENSEYLEIYFFIDVFVPTTQWVIKDSNLRPFAIIGEVQRSLSGKTINGLGKIADAGFSINFLTEDITAYSIPFKITQYS